MFAVKVEFGKNQKMLSFFAYQKVSFVRFFQINADQMALSFNHWHGFELIVTQRTIEPSLLSALK